MNSNPKFNEGYLKGEIRQGMKLYTQIVTEVQEGTSMIGERVFPTEQESEALTELIAKRKRKRLPRVPMGTGT